MGLLENMSKDPVARMALRDAPWLEANTTVRDAVVAMRERKLGCAMVVDGRRKPVGMFTEGMITQLLTERGAEILDEPLQDHMAEHWPWVQLDDPVADVLDAMQAKNVRFLCVVDDRGRAHAVTGQKGLMEYIAEHFPGQVMVQRVGGTPYLHKREGA